MPAGSISRAERLIKAKSEPVLPEHAQGMLNGTSAANSIAMHAPLAPEGPRALGALLAGLQPEFQNLVESLTRNQQVTSCQISIMPDQL